MVQKKKKIYILQKLLGENVYTHNKSEMHSLRFVMNV